MGELVEFASNGSTAQGYLALPESGTGPGLIVIQEWWGLNDHIKDLTDRFAAAGYVALAPDLYHGTVVEEPDEAGKEMMALQLERAANDLSGAVDEVRRRSGADKIGVTGFCMGGGLTLTLAAQRPDAVAVAVAWYGVIPWENAQPDWSAVEGRITCHIASEDGFFGPEAAAQLEATLADLGKDHEFWIYEGAEHAFFNDTRPEVYHAEHSATAWQRTLDELSSLSPG
ncbi:MAG: dienelactone hydrolase family protein [Acidimicrobiales bacterium]